MATGFAKSHYLEQKILDGVLRNVAYAFPAAVYAALFTGLPTDVAGGGIEVNTAGTSYARQAITFAPSANNGVNTGSTIQNSVAVTFPVATATYGSVAGIGVFDAAVGGNLLYYGALTALQPVNTGDQAVFPVGDLLIGED